MRAADRANHGLERDEVLDGSRPVPGLLLDLAGGRLGGTLAFVEQTPGSSQFQTSGTKRCRQDIRTCSAVSSSTMVIAAGGRVTVWCSNRSPDGCEMSTNPTVTHLFS